MASFSFCLLAISVLVLGVALKLFSWLLSNKTVVRGDYMIPFGWDEILSRLTGIPAVL